MPVLHFVATEGSRDLTAGGVYSSAAGLTIDPTTGDITPASSTAGTYTVTYTLPPASGCGAATATTTVTITALPAATISYAGPFCRSGFGTQPVTRTGTIGGTYTATPAGLIINGGSGAITPTRCRYLYCYLYHGGRGDVPQTATTTVTIIAVPTATITMPVLHSVSMMLIQNRNINRYGRGFFTATPRFIH
jgi:hypothetical protein